MTIDGTIINAEVSDIISKLKAQLEDNGVYLFARTKDSADDLMVCCPYHKDGQESNPSMGIRKSDGVCHCFACGETRSLPEMISDCFGTNNSVVGYKWLLSNFASASIDLREPIKFNLNREPEKASYTQFSVPEEELDGYRYYHPYMRKRGLTDKIIEMFDIGYDKKSDSITFPVRDYKTHLCNFVAKRKVAYKKFDLPRGIDKPLYGLYEVYQQSAPISEIYVCEGLFDCLRLWCNGKVAVAGFGCLFNKKQVEQLQNLPTRKLVLALDTDIAGQVATMKLREQIHNKILTQVIIPQGRKDIGECTDEEIQNLKEFL